MWKKLWRKIEEEVVEKHQVVSHRSGGWSRESNNISLENGVKIAR